MVLRVEGDNEAGLAHRLTQQWAIAGISFQGLTMAVVNGKFIGYAMFDTVTDSNKAATILADLGTHHENRDFEPRIDAIPIPRFEIAVMK